MAENFKEDTLIVRAGNSGDLYIRGSYNQIRTSSHGNGDIYLAGSCNSFYIYTKGINFVHAEDLKIKDYAFVHSITLGDCFINAKSLTRLEINIQDQGNVYYSGEPTFLVDYNNGTGKGKIIKQ